MHLMDSFLGHMGKLAPGRQTILSFNEARDTEWQRHQLGYVKIICTSLQIDTHISTSSVIFKEQLTPTNSDKTLRKKYNMGSYQILCRSNVTHINLHYILCNTLSMLINHKILAVIETEDQYLKADYIITRESA